MSDRLDGIVLYGRLRQASQPTGPRRSVDTIKSRNEVIHNRSIKRQYVTSRSRPTVAHNHRQAYSKATLTEPDNSAPVIASSTALPTALPAPPKQTRTHSSYRYTKLQLVIFGMAGLIFLVGSLVSLQTQKVNQLATAQVSALAKQSTPSNNAQNGPVPSTVKPSVAAVKGFYVAPNLPRYLNIPGLGVHARVLSLGLLSSGALATPSNVYDAGWYSESSQPGQPGAMLIDGHVSSWTTKGVFFGIKTLKPGNQLQIVRGDGAVINYQVVKSQTYADNNVDMKAAMTPVVAGKPGLNLITCTGRVKPGTSEFNQRVIVYAEQM